MQDNLPLTLILIILVLFVLFLLLREFNAWYWKINDIIKILSRIDAKLTAQGQSSKSVPEVASTESSIEEALATIECPKCHKSEQIRKRYYKRADEYKNFKVKYSSFTGSLAFVCNNCGNKFKKESQLI